MARRGGCRRISSECTSSRRPQGEDVEVGRLLELDRLLQVPDRLQRAAR